MADCQPMIDAAFLHTVTGVDVSDGPKILSLTTIVSTLIGEELGACVDPADASMRLKVICAQYIAYTMQSGAAATGAGAGSVRAEQIGDYRVEYQRTSTDLFDLQVLRDMLKSMYGSSSYSVSTLATPEDSQSILVDYFDPPIGEFGAYMDERVL